MASDRETEGQQAEPHRHELDAPDQPYRVLSDALAAWSPLIPCRLPHPPPAAGETAAELDALLPSVLDGAFKGELRYQPP